MRENSEISRILKVLEGQEVVHKVIELYERSRLSELSRPADLREVNMDLPGVKGLFVKDIIGASLLPSHPFCLWCFVIKLTLTPIFYLSLITIITTTVFWNRTSMV